MGTMGFAFGGGFTMFSADSGNKTLTGAAANIGLGVDFGTVSYLVIY